VWNSCESAFGVAFAEAHPGEGAKGFRTRVGAGRFVVDAHVGASVCVGGRAHVCASSGIVVQGADVLPVDGARGA